MFPRRIGESDVILVCLIFIYALSLTNWSCESAFVDVTGFRRYACNRNLEFCFERIRLEFKKQLLSLKFILTGFPLYSISIEVRLSFGHDQESQS